MNERIGAIVVGAGVVGLAVGRALAQKGHEVIVLERNPRIGEGVSARSSEVIHAGIYYPTGSLKAELCVRGRGLLYDYVTEKGVDHARCGKLIVAVDDSQCVELEALRDKGRLNGVGDLELLTANDVSRRAAALRCAAALWSPSTGIVDSHGLMLAMQGDLEAAGGHVALMTRFDHATVNGNAIDVTLACDGERIAYTSDALINCASLDAVNVAHSIAGLDPVFVPPAPSRFARGNYFMLQGKSPFTTLVYPLPEPGGLGVHLTLDLAGRARFGPDVEWIDKIAYDVDPRRGDAFYGAIRRYWPDLPDDALEPGYAGVRPKIVGPGEPAGDFVISGPNEHGIAGLVNLFGIESPGLTAALAIADKVTSEL